MELYRRLPGKTCSSVSTIDPFEAAAVVMWSIQLLLAGSKKTATAWQPWLFILDKIESLKSTRGCITT